MGERDILFSLPKLTYQINTLFRVYTVSFHARYRHCDKEMRVIPSVYALLLRGR